MPSPSKPRLEKHTHNDTRNTLRESGENLSHSRALSKCK